MSAAPRVAFKKKKKKRKNTNIRSSSILEAVEKEEDAVEEVTLDNARFLQKARKKRGGLTAESLNENYNPADEVVSEKVMNKEFRVENQTDLINKQKTEWIEEQIEIQRTGKVSEKKIEKKMSAEDELYQTPAHLKVESKQGMEVDGAGWLTGISEVPLDISVKMDNISRTEAAKAALFSGKRPAQDKSGPSNIGSNFNRHKQKNAKKRKTQMGPMPAQRRNAPTEMSHHATDDHVASLFVKRYHWR